VSLGEADLHRVRRIEPDVVGVRGAACVGGRNGTVCADRVRALRAALGLTVPPFPASIPRGANDAAAPGAGR
jgi:hypothetical protein